MTDYDVTQDSHIGIWRCRFRECDYSVSVVPRAYIAPENFAIPTRRQARS